MRARYEVRLADDGPAANTWVEAMEMLPAPGRFRLKEDSELTISEIIIDDDGRAWYDEVNVDIDVYVRDEDDRWVPRG